MLHTKPCWLNGHVQRVADQLSGHARRIAVWPMLMLSLNVLDAQALFFDHPDHF
jgi:hypothetical protein